MTLVYWVTTKRFVYLLVFCRNFKKSHGDRIRWISMAGVVSISTMIATEMINVARMIWGAVSDLTLCKRVHTGTELTAKRRIPTQLSSQPPA